MNNKSSVLAIDGPSGSGKSTIAKILAEKLDLTYLDTGAMFRGVALYFHEQGITFNQEDKIAKELKELRLNYNVSRECLIEINGINYTSKLREHYVSKLASEFSALVSVREFLKKTQRDIAGTCPSVLEGRDIGTVIFPDAALKIFLTASVEMRAKRRFKEICAQDESLGEEDVLKDIIARDKRDETRENAPLEKAVDAIEIDSTEGSIHEVAQKIIDEFEQRKALFFR